jgi:hypothetical protein
LIAGELLPASVGIGLSHGMTHVMTSPMAKANASVIKTLVHLNQNSWSKRMSKFKGSLIFFLFFFLLLFFFLSDII